MTFKVYLDKSKEYRWRMVARNGKIVADSAEGYKTKGHCERAVRKVISELSTYTPTEVADDGIRTKGWKAPKKKPIIRPIPTTTGVA